MSWSKGGQQRTKGKKEEKKKEETKQNQTKAPFICLMRIITGKRIQDKAIKVSMSPASSIARLNASAKREREGGGESKGERMSKR